MQDDVRRVSLLKSHNFALGEISISTKDGSDVLKADVDFRKDHPFKRDIQIVPAINKGTFLLLFNSFNTAGLLFI